MRRLKFEEILINVFKVSNIEEQRQIMFKKTVQFFEFYTLENKENQTALIPYTDIFLNLISGNLKVSRLLCHVFSQVHSPGFRKKLILTIFNRLNNLNLRFEDLITTKKDTLKVQQDREVYIEHLKLIINLIMHDTKANQET